MILRSSAGPLTTLCPVSPLCPTLAVVNPNTLQKLVLLPFSLYQQSDFLFHIYLTDIKQWIKIDRLKINNKGKQRLQLCKAFYHFNFHHYYYGLWVKVWWVCVTRRSGWLILSLIWSENNNLINHAVYKYPARDTRGAPATSLQPEHAAPLRCAEVSPAHCDTLIDVISWPLFCWGLEMLILFWDTAVCDNASQWSVTDPAPAPCYSI